MSALARILRLIWRQQRGAMLAGLGLSVTVALAGAALLGLSGWFITAAGLAGAAGAGLSFDLFRPSAGVRLLALGRAGARYGERLATHGATLTALAALRVRLLAGLARAGFQVQSGLRGGQALNRITADVDALDMLAAGVVFPLLGYALTLTVTGAALWGLTTPALALWVAAGSAVLVLAALVLAVWAGAGPAARAEDAAQDLRAGIVDHLRARLLLAACGALPDARARLLARDAETRAQALRLARVRRGADAVLALAGAVITGGALWIGGQAVMAGRIGAAQAALAVFVALALAELSPPMGRALAGLGRIGRASARIAPLLGEDEPEAGPVADPGAPPGLHARGLSVAPLPGLPPVLRDVSLSVVPGQVLLLRGASGRGKTSLLNTLAGLVPPVAGQVTRGGRLGYLTQRPGLTSGTVAEVLALAAPDADAAQMQAALEAVALPVALGRRLGEGGAGLSGGESRRLALARVLLTRPDMLLLDEPGEGLDAGTGRAMLTGLRAALPEAAIVIAAHRGVPDGFADTQLTL